MKDGSAAIRAEIDLPAGTAVWVLSAHAFTLLSPILVIVVLAGRMHELTNHLAHPNLMLIAAGLFLLGSAFEAAQNTIDRWFYEGPYPAFNDFLFNGLIGAGLGAIAIAAVGVAPVVIVPVAAGMVAFVALYLAGKVPYPATGVLGTTGVLGLWWALDDPVVLLLAVFSTGLNIYFLELVVRTKAQSMHGAIALSNGIGMVVVTVALVAAADGTAFGWAPTLLVAGGIAVMAAAAWPVLSKLAPTPRPSGTPTQPDDRRSTDTADLAEGARA